MEDEPVILHFLERIIQGRFKNIKLLLFDDPLNAWHELSENDPDILITNFVMPRLSGGELLKRLAQKRASYPIILTSGFFRSDSKEVKECMDLNLKVTFLEKPFAPSSLLNIMNDGLGTEPDSEQ